MRSSECRAEIAKEWVREWIGAANPRFKEVEEDICNGDYNPALEDLQELRQEMMKRLYSLESIFDKIASAPKSADIDSNQGN